MLPSAVSDSRVHNILPNKIDTDFQFSRASAATRVNHQGLIENVGYFSDELVRNGNFSELGPELITNGDFATDSNWTKGNGWSISNGKAVANNVTNNLLSQTGISFIANKTYKLVYTVSNYVSGSVRPQLSGGGNPVQNLSTRNNNGTFTQYFVANGASINFRFKGFTNFTGSIDNVSVKQVDPDNDWILGTGWSYGDGILSCAGDSGHTAATQSISFEGGKTYKVVTDITITSGSFTIQFQGGGSFSGNAMSSSGIYTDFMTPPADRTTLSIRSNDGNGVGSVSSISVVEVLGDKPRLDYDPSNPTCPHLLLEPQSTNLVTFSEDFSQWSKNGSTETSNSTTSPDGKITADKITKLGTNANDRVLETISVSNSTVYNISVFVKNDTNVTGSVTTLAFRVSGGTLFRESYEWGANGLSFGPTGQTSGTRTNEILKDYGNGWYRIGFSFTTDGTSGNFEIDIDRQNGTNTTSIFVWGAMLEQQDYATSYIPTAGSQETRVQETCNSAGNVNTFNSEEGVLYAEIAALANDLEYEILSVSDGGTNNRAYLQYTNVSNQIKFVYKIGGATQAGIGTATFDIVDFHKIACKWKANDFALWIDGNEIGTDTNGSVNAAGTFTEVNFDSGNTIFYGKVKGLATYNRALTDTELYTITSTQYSAYSGMVAALGNYTIPC